ncbi:MAG: signal peptide peptidase SppA [Tannerella sp.]|jgi:protease-4|nr:signal peptide peptidase SppA [Tannerella sp.]
MSNFFKTFFAALAAVIVGAILFSIIGFIMFAGMAASMGSKSAYILKDRTVLQIDLNGEFSERENDSPLNAFTGGSTSGIDETVKAIRKAKDNDFVKGIYLKAGAISGGVASYEPIRRALAEFKESGKWVVAYGDTYTQGAYYIASVADKIIINPLGLIEFMGMGSTFASVRGMFDKLGIKYQVFKVGTYKSAVEPYIQDKMSDANREQVSSFLNSTWSHILKGISESRNLSVETLNDYADRCLLFTPADSLEMLGMVDTLLYTPDVEAYLKQLTETKDKDKLRIATVKNLQSVPNKQDHKKSKDRIAVLFAEGQILSDEATSSPLLSDLAITAKEFVAELKKLKEDENVKAVVFRVNSPGGSAYASEQIWNAVVELREVKPVVVSMGTYAASGGYYISCAANSIVAEPTTLTGSIGIFGLFPDGEQMAKNIGLSFDEVKTNRHSNFGGASFGIPMLVSAMSRGMTDEESKLLQSYIERGYDLFTTRCADGRSMTKAEIDAIGQGRVWTGAQALEIGLVDKLGGLDDAIAIAAEKAGIEEYRIKEYPVKEDFMTKLMKSTMDGAKMRFIKFITNEDDLKNSLIEKTIRTTDIRQAVMTERVVF